MAGSLNNVFDFSGTTAAPLFFDASAGTQVSGSHLKSISR